MKRITLSLLSALAIALIPASSAGMTDAEFAEAQAMTQAVTTLYGAPEFGAPADELPDISVQEVLTSAREYRAGEAIKGTFSVNNPSGYPAEGSYRAILIGNFDADGQYQTAYGVEIAETTFSLPAGGSREIPFSLKIPDGLSGENFRVRVQTRLAGSALRGWGDSGPVSVVGDGAYAEIEYAYLIGPDGLERTSGSGPFLGDDMPSISLRVGLLGGASSLTLTPTARLVNRGTGETSSILGSAVTVPTGAKVEGRIEFSRENLKPGVYEGQVSWAATDGRERASKIPVRLVVTGETATVHAVNSTAESVESGDDFTVSLDVSGSPLDPEASKEENAARRAWQADVEVAVTSGSVSVAKGNWKGSLPDDGTISIPLKAEADGAALVAKVTVRGTDGQVVFTREYPLLAASGSGAPVVPEPAIPMAFWVSVAGALALTVILVALLASRHRAAAASVVALALVIGAAVFAGAPSAAEADGPTECPFGANEWNEVLSKRTTDTTWSAIYTLYQESCSAGTQPGDTDFLDDDGTFSESVPLGIYINTPASNSTYYCGQAVTVTGTAYYSGCTNTGIYANTKVWVTRLEPDGTWAPVTPVAEYTKYAGASGDHDPFTIDTPFNIPVNMTTRDGQYRIHVRAQTLGGMGAPQAGYAYRDFRVKNCDLCKNIAGDQTTVPGGMSRDVAGLCQCPTGSGYNTASGQCEDDTGTCVTCGMPGTCPAGTKYCNGACVPEAVACGGVAIAACPIEPEQQYCAEIYNRAGARTDQFAGYTTEELEAIFGFGLREAVEKQQSSGTKDSIWGVVGRSTSLQGGLDARHGSSGCAGVMCTYGIDGCLATSDADSGEMAANCSPVNATGLSPKALLVVEPSVVRQGGSCRVSWSSHAMSSCTISGQGISSTALAGSSMTPALSDTATYQLRCTDSAGQAYAQVESCAVDPNVSEF